MEVLEEMANLLAIETYCCNISHCQKSGRYLGGKKRNPITDPPLNKEVANKSNSI
jgi:hypothetical protein